MNALIKIRCFLGLVRVEEGDFCALQTLELLVISFLEALYVLEVFKNIENITKNKLTMLGAHQILHTGRRVSKMGRCVSC